MKTYVLDALPLINLLRKERGWEQTSEIIALAEQLSVRVIMTRVNWGEIYYSILSQDGRPAMEMAMNAIQRMPIKVIETDITLTTEAAEFKARGGISYADCFAAALAKREKGVLVTADLEFKRLEKSGEIKVLWL
jgi:ribonuclease VapC